MLFCFFCLSSLLDFIFGSTNLQMFLKKNAVFALPINKKGKNQRLDLDDGESDDSQQMRYISFQTIVDATNGFSDDNKLGEGGFGPVYKVNYINQVKIMELIHHYETTLHIYLINLDQVFSKYDFLRIIISFSGSFQR